MVGARSTLRRFAAVFACGSVVAGLECRAVAQTVESRAAAPSVPAVVTLVTSRCERRTFDEEAFARLLRIELLADGVTEVRRRADAPSRATTPSLAVVSIEGGCGDEATVTVVIDDATTDKAVRRALALGDVAVVARPRTLALAVAELLRASWAELVFADAPRPRADVPPAVRAATSTRLAKATAPERALAPPRLVEASRTPPVARDLGRSWFVSAGLDGRFFFGGRVGMLGARGGVSLPLHGPLRLHGELGAWSGGADDTLGRIDLALATGALGVGIGLGAWRDLRIEIGPEVELGWAHVGGEARLATTAVVGGATWSSIGSVVATIRVRMAGRVWVTSDVRFGAVFKGVTATADDREAVGLSGAAGSVRLGVALEL